LAEADLVEVGLWFATFYINEEPMASRLLLG
jgi:hypothetical protein